MTQRTFIQQLKCALTDDELHAKGAMLAVLCRQLNETEENKRVSMSGYNTTLKEVKQRISETRESRETGHETREVSCTERFTKQNTVEVVRTDTNKIVDSRTMTAAERQGDMFDAPANGNDKAKDGKAKAKAKPKATGKAKPKAKAGTKTAKAKARSKAKGKGKRKPSLRDGLLARLSKAIKGISNTVLTRNEAAAMRRLYAEKLVGKKTDAERKVTWIAKK